MKVTSIMGILTLVVLVPAWADEPLDFADPTRPSMAEGGGHGGGGFVLQSTLVSPTRTLAFINGRALRVGGTLGQAVVTAIKPYEVVLNNAGKEIHLRLLPKLDKARKVIAGIDAP